MKNTDIAWAAGFVDGEAYIGFNGRSVSLIIGQRDRNPLDRFVRIFGIGIVRCYQVKYKGGHKANHILGYHGDNALFILRLLLPFLTVKQPLALLATTQYGKVKRQRPIAKLNHRKQVICQLRNAGQTFDIIGKALSISRQRAHQLYWAAPESVRLANTQLKFF